MKELLLIICFAALLGSCKKFEHREVKEIPECTYCHLADSIEGSYTGRLVERYYHPSGINYGNGSVYDTVIDTILTVYVDRTYDGLNYYEDSTIFKFSLSFFYDEIILTESSIQGGAFYPSGKFTEDNRMIIRRTKLYPILKNDYFKYLGYEFIGYKDE